MWQPLTYVFAALVVLTVVGTGIARSYVDRLRSKRTGIGGTQDIAMFGTFLTIAFLIATIVSFVMWHLSNADVDMRLHIR